MQLKEFVSVLSYIDKVINENNLPNLYQELINLLNQAQSSPSPENSAQLLQKKEQIEQLQTEIQPKGWDFLKLKLFEDYGADKFIGIKAKKALESIFEKYQADPAGAAQQVQEILNNLTNFNQTTKNLLSNMTNLATQGGEELEKGKQLLQLVFDKDSSVETLNDLEKYSKEWRIILLAFSRLTKDPAEESKIFSIQKGSPLVVDLALAVLVAKAIGIVVKELLSIYEKILSLRKLNLEIEKLQLENASLGMKQDEEKLLDGNVERIVGVLMEKFSNKLEGTNDTKEVNTALVKAIDLIYRFIDNGGRVDISEEDGSTDSLQMQLADKYKKIEMLEGSLEKRKLLQAKTIKTDSSDKKEEIVK